MWASWIELFRAKALPVKYQITAHRCWVCMACWNVIYGANFHCCWTWQIWVVFLYGRKAVRFLCKAPEYLTIRECTVQQGKWKPSSQRRSIPLTHGHATLSLVPSPRAAVWGLSHSSSNMMAASTSTTCKSKVSTKITAHRCPQSKVITNVEIKLLPIVSVKQIWPTMVSPAQ